MKGRQLRKQQQANAVHELKHSSKDSNSEISDVHSNGDPVCGIEDDDDIVQRSSILSYRLETNQDVEKKPRLGQALVQMTGAADDSISPDDDLDTINDPVIFRKHIKSLRNAIAELYLGIKQKTRDENENISPGEEEEERSIIFSLDTYVVIEYIKSSVDIILNLKFEEIEKRLLDKNTIQDSHVGNRLLSGGNNQDTLQSNTSDSSRSISNKEGPPKIYEELIQGLEADIRKHIRIEQQLKLHMESMENRIEELEGINEKSENELALLRKNQQGKTESKIRELENQIREKDEALGKLRDAEGRLRRDLEFLKKQITESVTQQTRSSDSFQIINLETNNSHLMQNQELNKTQPMMINHGNEHSITHQMRKVAASNQIEFGSYSSNNSFMKDSNSPDRRATPDINHPYLHHTQLIGKKKTITPGTSSKSKKIVPGSVVDSLGLQPSFHSALNTYSALGGSQNQVVGRIIGQRKLSSQQSRNTQGLGATQTQMIKSNAMKGGQKTAWLSTGSGLPTAHIAMGSYTSQIPQTGQFSNIINNNIQGLSINYSNQIIAAAAPSSSQDPVQQFANNFIGIPIPNSHITGTVEGVDSESSQLNSHRRCKSQNLKRDKANSALAAKKSLDRKKRGYQMAQDLSQDEILMNQITQAVVNGQADKFRSMGVANNFMGQNSQSNVFEETASFNDQANAFMVNDNLDSQHRRAQKHHGQSFTSNTLSGYSTQKVRTVSTRMPTSTNDEQMKNRFNQSYGGNSSQLQQLKKASITSTTAGGGIVIHSRNGNLITSNAKTNQSISQSVQKTSLSRSRNKKHQIMSNHTTNNAKLEGTSLLDMSFKPQNTNNGYGPVTIIKPSTSATNGSSFINQTNLQMLKQQIIAQKKASNLLMKGLSPLKK